MSWCYRHGLRPLLFAQDSEAIHNRTLAMLAGNWRLSSIVKLQSGSPFDVVTGSDDMLSGINSTFQRANQISGNTYGNKCTSDLIGTNPTCYWIDRNAFAKPAPGTVGTMHPGMLRGPGYFNIDAGLSRTFSVTEAQRVEVRVDATNILNRANFMNPSGNLTSNVFGRLQNARDARVTQFALKYLF